jgi:flagellar biosynthesis protein FlhF
MKLKTYVARNLNEALAQVKKDLGPEAVILSTHSRRTFSPSSGWPSTEVEVRAAMDEPSPGYAANFSPDSHLAWSLPKSLLHQLQAELKEMKGFLAKWLKECGPPAWLSQHGNLAFLYQRLVDQGVSPQVLLPWLAEIRELLTGAEHTPDTVKNAALRLLMHAFGVTNPWQQREKSEPCRWTFLGPTGVGKTTTIAKLAVHFTLIRKKKVGLISLDGIRLDTRNQLAVYGKLIEIPFTFAAGREELLAALTEMQDRELILIDTPGQSPASPEALNLIGEMPHLQHHLVVSAALSESNLAAAITGFSRVSLTSLIITKVDESQDFSGLFNQLCCRDLPVSYLTTGQRVPQDIEPASRQRLVALLLAPHQGSWQTTSAGETYEQAVGA